MAKRTKQKQSIHDVKVKNLANQLKRKGYNVKADLTGFEKPSPIGKNNRIPDIEATKRGVRKIVEVETPESLEKDKDQLSTFQKSAAQRKRTTFETIIAK